MAVRNYSNTAQDTTLNGSITDVATTATVTAATGWPAAPFTILIENEVILVGARTGTSLSSLTRGYDGTVAASHADTTAVKVVVVAQDFADVPTNLADLADVDSTAPTDGQVLTWDNANSWWEPAAAAGGGSGPPVTYGLRLWYDAQWYSDAGIANGATIGKLLDKSKDNNTSEVGGSPSFGTADTTINFVASSSEYFTLPNLVDVQRGTTVIVVAPTSTHASVGMGFSGRSSLSSDDRWYVPYFSSSDILAYTGSSTARTLLSSYTTGQFYRIIVRADGNSKEAWVDGSSVLTWTDSNTGTPSNLRLGAEPTSANTNFLDGNIKVVMHYDVALSDSQITSLDSWLSTTY